MEMFVMRQHPAMNAPHAFRCTVEIVIAARLRDECADDVAFLVGDACDCDGLPIGDVAPASLDRHLRLCFAMLDENELVEGVARIARRARELR